MSKFVLHFLLCSAILLPSLFASAQDSKIQVVASHGILADVIHSVGGDHIDLTLLIPATADPHSFEPSPRDLTPLADADLIFVNGAGFEEALLKTIQNIAAAGSIIEASACVEIIAFGDDHDDHADHDDEHSDEAHHDDHDDEHADHDDDEHAHDDDEHSDEAHHDDHDDEHAHDDDEHSDDHDDEHAHDDDEHSDEHAHDDDEHSDEHDDEHAHDDEHEHSEGAFPCDDHSDELHDLFAESHADHDHPEFATLGRLQDVDCAGGEEDEHDDHDDEDHHGHNHGLCDPHVWANPQNVMYWTLLIRDALSTADPANGPHYAANATSYLQALNALVIDFIEPAVASLPHENRVLLTGHETLAYFAAAYDFEILSAVLPSLTTTVEPSASDVAQIIDLIRAENVPALFAEQALNQNIVQAIQAETGIAIVPLQAERLTEDDGPAPTYLDYLRYNVGQIVNALSGE